MTREAVVRDTPANFAICANVMVWLFLRVILVALPFLDIFYKIAPRNLGEIRAPSGHFIVKFIKITCLLKQRQVIAIRG
jgi:hypothetical protein